MRMRTQIFLFLFFFGLMPMLSVVALNLPLVQSKIEVAVRDYQIQSLSTEFIDLGQHIATRQEMVRFLAKVPDPTMLLGDRLDEKAAVEDAAKEDSDSEKQESKHTDLGWFINWVNRMLRGGQDVIEVRFLDNEGNHKLVLTREKVGFPLAPVTGKIAKMNPIYFNTAKMLPIDLSYVGPIKVKETPAGSILTMNMSSAITQTDGEKAGVVVIKINVAGMPQRFKNTIWVYNDGRYLRTPGMDAHTSTAFEDFPGLNGVFETVDKGVWQGKTGRQTIWIPLFPTEQSGPIWVGRQVDPSSIETFKKELQYRVLVIIAALILSVVLVARWLSFRMERMSDDLTNGIARVVSNEPATFAWRGPEEIRQLGKDLTQLANIHATAQDALAKRAQELEQTNQYKSQFLANMSHELRTPLNAIIGFSELLKNQMFGPIGNPRYLEYSDDIQHAGHRLLNVIDDVLDISAIESQDFGAIDEEIDASELVAACVSMLAGRFKSSEITLTTMLAPNLPRLRGAQTRLKQIIVNLLENALKFSPAGGEVRIHAYSGENGGVTFEISDLGMGMVEADIPRLLEPFTQVHEADSRPHDGVGLGLYIANRLVELHDGRLDIVSAPGTGTKVYVHFPEERLVPAPV